MNVSLLIGVIGVIMGTCVFVLASLLFIYVEIVHHKDRQVLTNLEQLNNNSNNYNGEERMDTLNELRYVYRSNGKMNLIDFVLRKMFNSCNVKISPNIDNVTMQVRYQRQARELIQQAREMDEMSMQTGSLNSLGNSSYDESIHNMELYEHNILEESDLVLKHHEVSLEQARPILNDNLAIASNEEVEILQSGKAIDERLNRKTQKRLIGPDSEQAKRNRQNLKLVLAELRQ